MARAATSLTRTWIRKSATTDTVNATVPLVEGPGGWENASKPITGPPQEGHCPCERTCTGRIARWLICLRDGGRRSTIRHNPPSRRGPLTAGARHETPVSRAGRTYRAHITHRCYVVTACRNSEKPRAANTRGFPLPTFVRCVAPPPATPPRAAVSLQRAEHRTQGQRQCMAAGLVSKPCGHPSRSG